MKRFFAIVIVFISIGLLSYVCAETITLKGTTPSGKFRSMTASDGISLNGRPLEGINGVVYYDGSPLSSGVHSHSVLSAPDGNPSSALAVDNAGDVSAIGLLRMMTGLTSTGTGVTGSVAGNARGIGAVDLQFYRSAATQVASADYSVVIGGQRNAATSKYDVVLGGYDNICDSDAVYGGSSQFCSVILGGYDNQITNHVAGILSGKHHRNASPSGVICGGSSNEIGDRPHSFIGGGINNTIDGTNADGGIIVGGSDNTITGGPYATVLNGYQNNASGIYSISGGQGSTASAASAVALGQSTTASGTYSLALAGTGATASGAYSVAIGAQARATHTGAVVIQAGSGGVGYVDSFGDKTCVIRADGGMSFQTYGAAAKLQVTSNAHNEFIFTSWRYFDAVGEANGERSATTTAVGWYPDSASAPVYLRAAVDAKTVVFPIPYEDGTVVTRVSVRWQGVGASDGVILTIQKRQGGTASAAWTTVGAAQTYTGTTETNNVYDLPDETMASGYAYRVAVESQMVTSGSRLWEIGIETSKRTQ